MDLFSTAYYHYTLHYFFLH